MDLLKESIVGLHFAASATVVENIVERTQVSLLRTAIHSCAQLRALHFSSPFEEIVAPSASNSKTWSSLRSEELVFLLPGNNRARSHGCGTLIKSYFFKVGGH